MIRNREGLVRFALVAGGTVVSLLVGETGARGFVVLQERGQGRIERDLAGIRPPQPGQSVTLGQIIQRSANPGIVYELRPRLDVQFARAHLTTSDVGYRGSDVAARKPEGGYRILGVGDSYMFGQGVSDEETYLARLPAELIRAGGSPDVETVNLAVPGFNTAMEVAMLRSRAVALDPDLILIEIVGNDLDLPNFLWRVANPWAFDRSFLLDFIKTRLSRHRVDDAAGGLVIAPIKSDSPVESFSRESADVPEQYRSMVGLEALQNSLTDLARFGRERKLPVMAVTHGVWFESELMEALERNQIPVLVLRSALRQRARALGAPDYARSPLALSPGDLHPSALGHKAIAEELAAWLKSSLVKLTPPS